MQDDPEGIIASRSSPVMNTRMLIERAPKMNVINADLIGVPVHCTVCTNVIPEEEARRKAVVCSEECREKLKRLRRKHKDDKQCRFCHRPATISQRQAFSRFQRWELEHPELANPDTWRVLSERGISPAVFAAAAKEARTQDFSFEYTPFATRWTRFPKPNRSHENLDKCIAILQEFWTEKEANDVRSEGA